MATMMEKESPLNQIDITWMLVWHTSFYFHLMFLAFLMALLQRALRTFSKKFSKAFLAVELINNSCHCIHVIYIGKWLWWKKKKNRKVFRRLANIVKLVIELLVVSLSRLPVSMKLHISCWLQDKHNFNTRDKFSLSLSLSHAFSRDRTLPINFYFSLRLCYDTYLPNWNRPDNLKPKIRFNELHRV